MTEDQTRQYKVTVDGKELAPDSEPIEGQIAIEGFKIIPPKQREPIANLQRILNTEAQQAIKKALEKIAAEYQELIESYPEVQALTPFLAVELEEAQKQGQYQGITLKDLLSLAFYADGTPREGEYMPLVQKAREQLPRIMAIPSDKLPLPLDKLNAWIWGRLTPEELEQISFDTAAGKDKRKGKEALINFGIDFDALEAPGSGVTITKQLTPFDKRVYLAAASLFDAGNEIISTTQIYNTMGYRGKPSSEHTQRINESLSKMGTARVKIDNSNEAAQYKGYTVFKYDASLLPFERISAYINNQITEAAIHLFREPPLVTFAKDRKQITSIPKPLLETPVSKTETNLRFEDYLLQQISHMKNNKRFSRSMLYSTIFNACQITTQKQKQRAPETIRRILNHYTDQRFITGYIETKESITIKL